MRKRLGEILIGAGVIDELQLRSALAEAARWGKRIGEVLVVRGHCTEAQILEALASQLGVAVAPMSAVVSIPPRVLRLLPPTFARDRQVLPLGLDARTGALDLAVADPASYELLDEVRFRTGHEIRPMVSTPHDLKEAIDHFYFGAPRFPPPADAARDSIELPPLSEELDDSDNPFQHEVVTGDFQGKPRNASPSSAPPALEPSGAPARPAIQIKVHRTAVASPAASVGAGDSVEMSFSPSRIRPPEPTTPPVGQHPEDEIARLNMQVADLQAKLDRVYSILREAAVAHRTLLGELSERGLVERQSYSRKVREALQATAREGDAR